MLSKEQHFFFEYLYTLYYYNFCTQLYINALKKFIAKLKAKLWEAVMKVSYYNPPNEKLTVLYQVLLKVQSSHTSPRPMRQ
jgi:hypothetical protein